MKICPKCKGEMSLFITVTRTIDLSRLDGITVDGENRRQMLQIAHSMKFPALDHCKSCGYEEAAEYLLEKFGGISQ